jgi:sugar phosphate isomerase/epimerase
MSSMSLSRRSFLLSSAILGWRLRAETYGRIPIGLELYSVRDAFQKDPEGTMRSVAQMGYECVEFYAPYYEWTDARAKQMRKLLDQLGLHCYSTHNDYDYFGADKIQRARDLNLIMGSKYVVMASTGEDNSSVDWKTVSNTLNAAADELEQYGLKVGFHNHQPEFTAVNGVRPIETLAKNTNRSVMLQLDVGTCLEARSDPVAWIEANLGRIRSLHLKDWSSDPAKGYKVLFGEGDANWNRIFAAADSVGGVEYYLIEQEGSRFSEVETARRCLQSLRTLHG